MPTANHDTAREGGREQSACGSFLKELRCCICLHPVRCELLTGPHLAARKLEALSQGAGSVPSSSKALF